MKKSHLFSFFALLFFSLVFSSCNKEESSNKKEEGIIQVNYAAKINNTDLVFDQNYVVGNDTLMFRLVKFYISNFAVEDKDGQEIILLDDLHLVDLKSKETTSQRFELEATAYKNPNFLVGLTDEVNATDPSMYSKDHPLSLQQGNYWMMADSYIFFKVEGFRKMGALNEPFVYHIGLDGMGTEVLTPKAFSVNEGNTTNINVSLDFNAFFSTIDLDTEANTHTTDNKPLADKIMLNFVNALTVN